MFIPKITTINTKAEAQAAYKELVDHHAEFNKTPEFSDASGKYVMFSVRFVNGAQEIIPDSTKGAAVKLQGNINQIKELLDQTPLHTLEISKNIATVYGFMNSIQLKYNLNEGTENQRLAEFNEATTKAIDTLHTTLASTKVIDSAELDTLYKKLREVLNQIIDNHNTTATSQNQINRSMTEISALMNSEKVKSSEELTANQLKAFPQILETADLIDQLLKDIEGYKKFFTDSDAILQEYNKFVDEHNAKIEETTKKPASGDDDSEDDAAAADPLAAPAPAPQKLSKLNNDMFKLTKTQETAMKQLQIQQAELAAKHETLSSRLEELMHEAKRVNHELKTIVTEEADLSMEKNYSTLAQKVNTKTATARTPTKVKFKADKEVADIDATLTTLKAKETILQERHKHVEAEIDALFGAQEAIALEQAAIDAEIEALNSGYNNAKQEYKAALEGYKANITNANNTHTTKQAELDNELTTASSKLDLDELEANAQAEAIHAAGVTEIAQKTKDATTDLLKVIKEMRDAHNTAADAAKASATPDTDMIAFHKNATTAIMNEAAAKAETIKATKTAATAELEAAHEARLQDIAKHFANEVESLNANIANAKAAYNDGFAKHLIDAQQPATEALVKLNEAEKAADSTETKWLLEGKTTFDTIMPALDDAIAELDGAAVAADTDTEASEDEDETDTADENEDEAAPAPAPAEAAPAPAVVVAEGEDEAAPAPAEGDNAADIDVTGASAKYACEFDQYQ